MATEVCDCKNGCSGCCPPFKPEHIYIEVTLQGKTGSRSTNQAMSFTFVTERLTKRRQREIAKQIAKMVGVEMVHAV